MSKRAAGKEENMPAKKWQVIEGVEPEKVQFALFCPPPSLSLSLTIQEAGNPEASPFKIEVDILELWAGNGKTGRKPKGSWEGMYGLRGKVAGCPQLTRSNDPQIVTTVSVTYKMGESVGELEVINIE